MSEQFKFRMYCVTESNFVDFWSYDDPPTACPNSYKHEIDKTKLYKLDERYVGRKNVVYIKEEETPTQGNYRYECIKYNVSSNADQILDYRFPYPINMLEVKIKSNEHHRGDVLNCTVVPDMPVGYLLSNANIGDSNLYVSNTVLSYMKIGYHTGLINRTNGHNEDLDEVLVKNDANNMISTQYCLSNAYPAGSYVKMHVNIIKNLEFQDPEWYIIGDRKIGASYLPGKTTLRMYYSNSNLQEKELLLYTQYLY